MGWLNQRLIASGQTDKLLTDLVGDISDGVTLLRVVEAIGIHKDT